MKKLLVGLLVLVGSAAFSSENYVSCEKAETVLQIRYEKEDKLFNALSWDRGENERIRKYRAQNLRSAYLTAIEDIEALCDYEVVKLNEIINK